MRLQAFAIGVLWTVLAAVVWAQVPAAPAAAPAPAAGPTRGPGYTDTPFLPGDQWRVHDAARPRPPVVAPAPAGEPVPPPADAIVLFDGTDLSKWQNPKGEPAGWKVENGYVEIVKKAGDIQTREAFGSCQLHLEWMAPNPPSGKDQGRGNSGVFLMGRYELQVLDCYDNLTYADGQTAALYGQTPPLVNVCRPPGEWQTYDVVFAAPVFEGGKVAQPAYVTLFHNGVLVHHHVALLGSTSHKRLPAYSPHPAKGPIRLQDHGSPVRFRNLWIRPLD